jgi:Flp pilus assembly protein TadG
MKTLRSRVRSQRGAELIEFALVLPLLLLVVLGIVDFGFLFQRMEVVTNAAREGARLGVLPSYTSTDACNRVLNYMQTGGLTTSASCPTSGSDNPQIVVNQSYPISIAGGGTVTGTRVAVTYNYSYLFIGPIARLFGGSLSSVPVNGVAVMRNENAASGS